MANILNIKNAADFDYLPHDHVNKIVSEAREDGSHAFVPFVYTATDEGGHKWERAVGNTRLAYSFMTNLVLFEDADENTKESLGARIETAEEEIAQGWHAGMAIGLRDVSANRKIGEMYGLVHLAGFAVRDVVTLNDKGQETPGLVPEPLFTDDHNGAELFRAPELSLANGLYVLKD